MLSIVSVFDDGSRLETSRSSLSFLSLHTVHNENLYNCTFLNIHRHRTIAVVLLLLFQKIKIKIKHVLTKQDLIELDVVLYCSKVM